HTAPETSLLPYTTLFRSMQVRDLYARERENAERLRDRVDDAYIADFSRTVAGELGAKVGLAPRIFLRKLVDVLDRVDQFEDFDRSEEHTSELQSRFDHVC